MDRKRLETILSALPRVKIAVFGDFFLDRYFVIDPELAEVSLETGLTVHQVVGRRLAPGAAGTVVSNLRALGIGRVICLGAIGVDGEGFDLKRGLDAIGADSSRLIGCEDRFTPCYTKPMLRENGQEREIERIDIKNRSFLPAQIEDQLLSALDHALPEIDGVVIADQVQERNCGCVTDRIRHALADLADLHPQKVFLADSRVRIGEFRNVITKPNKSEAVKAVGPEAPGFTDSAFTLDEARSCAARLRERTRKPVFMTAQEEGIFIFDENTTHIPALTVQGQIDPVGAGDSCTAGIISALCAGAVLDEAAFVGNIVASVTVQKIGVTGTASPDEVLARFDEFASQAR